MANMQNENFKLQYGTNYEIDDHQHQGYKTENYEYEISNIFPVRPPVKYQSLFDYRIQLLVLYDTTINSGETQSIPTTCNMLPIHGWCLTIVSNPALTLLERKNSHHLHKVRKKTSLFTSYDE